MMTQVNPLFAYPRDRQSSRDDEDAVTRKLCAQQHRLLPHEPRNRRPHPPLSPRRRRSPSPDHRESGRRGSCAISS